MSRWTQNDIDQIAIAVAFSVAIGFLSGLLTFVVRAFSVGLPMSSFLPAMVGMGIGLALSPFTAAAFFRKRAMKAALWIAVPTAGAALACGVISSGLGVISSLLVFVVSLSLVRWRMADDPRRWVAWACRGCGYDLRGSVGDVCPECGARVVGVDGSKPPG
jgi:hypothetical protein